jgi:hypothetical protein
MWMYLGNVAPHTRTTAKDHTTNRSPRSVVNALFGGDEVVPVVTLSCPIVTSSRPQLSGAGPTPLCDLRTETGRPR